MVSCKQGDHKGRVAKIKEKKCCSYIALHALHLWMHVTCHLPMPPSSALPHNQSIIAVPPREPLVISSSVVMQLCEDLHCIATYHMKSF